MSTPAPPAASPPSGSLFSVVSALKSVIGEKDWNQRLHSSSAKLSMIQALQSAVDPNASVGLADAMNLIVQLNIVAQEQARSALVLSAQVVPADVPLTVKSLFTMLSTIATQHPNSTADHKRAVSESIAALQQLPDTQMTNASFFQVLANVLATPVPVRHRSSGR